MPPRRPSIIAWHTPPRYRPIPRPWVGRGAGSRASAQQDQSATARRAPCSGALGRQPRGVPPRPRHPLRPAHRRGQVRRRRRHQAQRGWASRTVKDSPATGPVRPRQGFRVPFVAGRRGLARGSVARNQGSDLSGVAICWRGYAKVNEGTRQNIEFCVCSKVNRRRTQGIV
jgi:hypothetical protein